MVENYVGDGKMQETNEVKDDVTLEETVAENLKDEQVVSQENPNAPQEATLEEEKGSKKANKISPEAKKGMLQFILFIVMSLVAFVLQILIVQFGDDILIKCGVDGTKKFTAWIFGEYTVATFVAFLVGNVVAKVVSYILNRKKTFAATNNLAFSFTVYIIMCVVLIIVETLIGPKLATAYENVIPNSSNYASTLSMITYSIADFVIVFLMEKFVIMNNKLFAKKAKSQSEGDGVAIEGEGDASAVSEEGAVAVAADVATDETKDIKEPEVDNASQEIVILSQNEDIATPEEEVKEEVKPEEEVKEESDAPILSLEEAAEVAQEEVIQEEIKLEEQSVAEAKPAKKAPAKKTTTAAKKTTAATKKTTSTAKTTASKTTASKTAASKSTAGKSDSSKATAAKKSTSTAAAKKPATVKATATKAPAKKNTTTAAKKTTAASKTTAAKKTTSAAKKTTAAKAEENKD